QCSAGGPARALRENGRPIMRCGTPPWPALIISGAARRRRRPIAPSQLACLHRPHIDGGVPGPGGTGPAAGPRPTEGGQVDAETLEFLDSLVRESTEVEAGILIPSERRRAWVSGKLRARVRLRHSRLQMLGMLVGVQGSDNVVVTASFDGDSINAVELMLRAGMVTVPQIAEAREMHDVAIAPRIVEPVTD